VTCVTFHPFKPWLTYASENSLKNRKGETLASNKLVILNIETNKVVFELPQDGIIRSVNYSSDGVFLALAVEIPPHAMSSAGKKIAKHQIDLYNCHDRFRFIKSDRSTMMNRKNDSGYRNFSLHRHSISTVVFRPKREAPSQKAWDKAIKKCQFDVYKPEKLHHSSSDYLVASCDTSCIRLWNFFTDRTWSISNNVQNPRSLSFSSDGLCLVCVQKKNEIRAWSILDSDWDETLVPENGVSNGNIITILDYQQKAVDFLGIGNRSRLGEFTTIAFLNAPPQAPVLLPHITKTLVKKEEEEKRERNQSLMGFLGGLMGQEEESEESSSEADSDENGGQRDQLPGLMANRHPVATKKKKADNKARTKVEIKEKYMGAHSLSLDKHLNKEFQSYTDQQRAIAEQQQGEDQALSRSSKNYKQQLMRSKSILSPKFGDNEDDFHNKGKGFLEEFTQGVHVPHMVQSNQSDLLVGQHQHDIVVAGTNFIGILRIQLNHLLVRLLQYRNVAVEAHDNWDKLRYVPVQAMRAGVWQWVTLCSNRTDPHFVGETINHLRPNDQGRMILSSSTKTNIEVFRGDEEANSEPSSDEEANYEEQLSTETSVMRLWSVSDGQLDSVVLAESPDPVFSLDFPSSQVVEYCVSNRILQPRESYVVWSVHGCSHPTLVKWDKQTMRKKKGEQDLSKRQASADAWYKPKVNSVTAATGNLRELSLGFTAGSAEHEVDKDRMTSPGRDSYPERLLEPPEAFQGVPVVTAKMDAQILEQAAADQSWLDMMDGSEIKPKKDEELLEEALAEEKKRKDEEALAASSQSNRGQCQGGCLLS